MWTGVTGISLCTAGALAGGTDSVGSRWYNHTHFRSYFTNCRTYQLYWRRCWNCPPSLSIRFWQLFIKFSITRFSSRLSMLLISSRISRFSSYRVRGFVLHTAFFNLPQRQKSQVVYVGGTSRPWIPTNNSVIEHMFNLRIEIGWQTELTNNDHK